MKHTIKNVDFGVLKIIDSQKPKFKSLSLNRRKSSIYKMDKSLELISLLMLQLNQIFWRIQNRSSFLNGKGDMDNALRKLINGMQFGMDKNFQKLVDIIEEIKNIQGKILYSDKGEKQGLWMDLIKNFQNNAKAYEFGEYINNKRVGTWKQFYQDKQLGVGNYNEQGQRDGKWTQLSDYFFNQKQVIYEGEYKNGKKVGLWNIYYENLFIGGGLYEYKKRGESLEQTKIGKWIELSEGFYDWSQVTYEGQYKNGKRFGRWNIWFKKNYGDKNIELIGGGLYDCEQQNDGLGALKIGKWIELSEGFNCNNQITYSGVYKKGFKVGRWNTFDQKNYIGGGVYEQKLEYDGMCTNKVGRWMELSDGFSCLGQVIYNGIYKNGKKIGRWDITFTYDGRIDQIGGGFYDEQNVGNAAQVSIKTGRWIEESDSFDIWSQVVYDGEYVNGKKIGKWNILFRKYGDNQKFEQIGEGYYSEKQECDGLLGSIKIGRWVELFERFGSGNLLQQIVYNGEYKNGFKIGRWNTLYRGDTEIQFQQIGGGSYIDKQGSTKNGQWKELSDNFQNDFEQSQIIENGHYKNGKKIGKWEVMDFSRKNKIIDYKYYDDSKNIID